MRHLASRPSRLTPSWPASSRLPRTSWPAGRIVSIPPAPSTARTPFLNKKPQASSRSITPTPPGCAPLRPLTARPWPGWKCRRNCSKLKTRRTAALSTSAASGVRLPNPRRGMNWPGLMPKTPTSAWILSASRLTRRHRRPRPGRMPPRNATVNYWSFPVLLNPSNWWKG